MFMTDDDIKTARGDELAQDAPTGPGATPDVDELAKGGPRGDGLAREEPASDSTPDPEDIAEGSPRGDGLANDA